VRGNPQAEEHARTARALAIAAAVLDLVAAGSLGGGLYVATQHDSESQILGVGFASAGAACLLTGAILAVVAIPHKMDAINIYNDGVLPAGPPPQPIRFLPPPTGAATGPRRDASTDRLLLQ
jgi:hypothetical protein